MVKNAKKHNNSRSNFWENDCFNIKDFDIYLNRNDYEHWKQNVLTNMPKQTYDTNKTRLFLKCLSNKTLTLKWFILCQLTK